MLVSLKIQIKRVYTRFPLQDEDNDHLFCLGNDRLRSKWKVPRCKVQVHSQEEDKHTRSHEYLLGNDSLGLDDLKW